MFAVAAGGVSVYPGSVSILQLCWPGLLRLWFPVVIVVL